MVPESLCSQVWPWKGRNSKGSRRTSAPSLITPCAAGDLFSIASTLSGPCFFCSPQLLYCEVFMPVLSSPHPSRPTTYTPPSAPRDKHPASSGIPSRMAVVLPAFINLVWMKAPYALSALEGRACVPASLSLFPTSGQ